MIDLESTYMRAYLDAASTRIETASTVLDWAHGQQSLSHTELVPPFPTDPDAKDRAEADWTRYTKQIQSLGPRVLKTKRGGAIGDVNWGGDDTGGIDDRLESLDLRALARGVFDPLCSLGIAAAWAYRDADTNRTRAQTLGGYLEPIYREDDPSGEIIGLYQATQDPDERRARYRVRVYDFEARSIREWRNLSDPTNIGGPADEEWTGTSVPRVAVYDTTQDGYPVGELAQALATLKGEIAIQLRILRVADGHANPILYQTGGWDDVKELGGTTVLRSSEPGATAGRIEPSDLATLFTLHDRAMERLRADLSLPIASIGGGDWPSGEALQQANVAYVTSSKDYALLVGELLTGVVEDYATLEGISDPPPVSVTTNREQMRQTISTQVREDYKAGVISLRMAVTALAPYYPATDSEGIEEFLEREETPLRASPFLPSAADGDE